MVGCGRLLVVNITVGDFGSSTTGAPLHSHFSNDMFHLIQRFQENHLFSRTGWPFFLLLLSFLFFFFAFAFFSFLSFFFF